MDCRVPQRCPPGAEDCIAPPAQWAGAWGPLLSLATLGASGARALLWLSTLVPHGFSWEGVFKDPSSKDSGFELVSVYSRLAWLLESDVFLKESLYLDDLQKKTQTFFIPSLFEAHPLTLQRGEE